MEKENNKIENANIEANDPIAPKDLESIQAKLNVILKKYSKKLEETKPGLFILPKEVKGIKNEIRTLFQNESVFPLKSKQNFSVILDSKNFIDLNSTSKDENKNLDEIVKEIFSINKDKGIILLLLDDNNLEQALKSISNEFNTNEELQNIKLFMNFYFINYLPLMYLLVIQKMTSSSGNENNKDLNINHNNTKILVSDFSRSIRSLGGPLFSELLSFIKEDITKIKSYNKEMKTDYLNVSELNPGRYFYISRKISPLFPDISHFITIYDANDDKIKELGTSVAIILSYEYEKNLVFTNRRTHINLCNQNKASRIFLVEPSLSNPINVHNLIMEVNKDLEKLNPKSFGNKEIIYKAYDDSNEDNKENLLLNRNFLVRDIESKDKELNFRQLYLNPNTKESQFAYLQVKTKLTSKKNAHKKKDNSVGNSNASNYIQIETQNKFLKKNIIQCIDDTCVCSLYDRSLLCMPIYLDYKNYPKEKVKICELKGGAGFITMQMNKIYKSNVNIDVVDDNKELREICSKYFGLSFNELSNVKWFKENPIDFVLKFDDKNNNKLGDGYDFILNEFIDINDKSDISPSKEYFEDNFLQKLCKLLKPMGIYAVFIIAKNVESLYKAYDKLTKYFKTIYVLRSDGKLVTIYFCIQGEIDITKYTEIYNENIKSLESGEFFDFSVVQGFYRQILCNLEDTEKELNYFKKNLNIENIK